MVGAEFQTGPVRIAQSLPDASGQLDPNPGILLEEAPELLGADLGRIYWM
jgi:hypothetical protein